MATSHNRGSRDDHEELDILTVEVLSRFCGSSLDAIRNRRCAVLRNALDASWLGWSGRLAEVTTRSSLSFFPATQDGQTAFSRCRHASVAAKTTPSVAFWRWLAATPQPWQMRGLMQLSAAERAEIVGVAISKAIQKGVVKVTQESLWAGAGGTRTPLHVDRPHAIIFQVEGTKRFFVSSRARVEEAVQAGRLPEAVKTDGTTECFCVDGSQDDIYGPPDGPAKLLEGSVVELHAGDCLLLPGGLFHDVQCATEAPASMSLTIRFELQEWLCDDPDRVH